MGNGNVVDDRMKEITRRREAGESWRVISEAIPGAYRAYWKVVGKDARPTRARASWRKRLVRAIRHALTLLRVLPAKRRARKVS